MLKIDLYRMEQELATDQLKKCLIKWRNEAIKKFGTKMFKTITLKSDVEGVETVNVLCQKNGNAELHHLERERNFACVARVFWNPNLIQFFVNRGNCDVNAKDENGDTALNLALRYAVSRRGLKIVQKIVRFLLEECSADPNARNLRGEDAIFTLFRNEKMVWNERKDSKMMLEIAEMLIERGACVTTRNSNGQSVLHFNHVGPKIYEFLIEKFLDAGEVIDVRSAVSYCSQTPLMVAARGGNVGYCRRLVEKGGADVNAVDLQGYTPLHHAVLSKNSKCVRLLFLDLGANPMAQTACERDARDLSYLCESLTRYRADTYPQKISEILEKAVTTINTTRGASDASHFSRNNGQETTTVRNNDAGIPGTFSGRSQYLMNINSKLWFAIKCTNSGFSGLPNYKGYALVFRILSLFDISELVSCEEIDFSSRLRLFIDNCPDNVVRSFDNDAISDIHRIVNLFVACARERIRRVNGSKIWPVFLVYESYVSACLVLMRVRQKFELRMGTCDVTLFNENERLLKTLFELDLGDVDGNGLIHFRRESLTLRNKSYYLQLVRTLISNPNFESDVVIKSKNRLGFEPVQTIDWENKLLLKEINGNSFQPRVLLDMADRGAHVDAKNAWGCASTLRDVLEERCGMNSSFPYDTLQCACARILVRNVVPYRNRYLPKQIVEFIDNHQ